MIARMFIAASAALLALAGPAHAQAVAMNGDSTLERNARIDAQFAVATTRLRAMAAEALGPGALPPPPAPMVRKSITALSSAELASLRKGIAQMIAWNSAPHGSANYKRSLVYWANMHSFIGVNNQCSSSSGLSLPGMAGLSLQQATTPDELATWCTCQHGTIQFLTWHRMYVYYFEQVLRAAAGDPNLTLPYWDYETNGQIPAAYRSATYVNSGGQTVANPLYVANRQAQLAAGGSLSASVVSTTNAMAKTSYSPFNSTLEGTPHGSVHCATGVQNCPSGYMGYVPSAGNDPIFYSHHDNIDRLYECWLQVSPLTRLPSGAMLDTQFSFIDGAGNLVKRRVGDMLTTQQLGYTYTRGGGCPPVRIRRPDIFLQLAQPFRVFALRDGFKLELGTTRVPLRIAAETRRALTAAVPGDTKRTPQAMLVLDGLQYDALPGVMYEVYLQNAAGKRALLGVINFFTATAPHAGLNPNEGMAGMEGMDHQAPPTSFDAGEALRALGGGEAATLVIEPITGIAGSTPAQAARGINPRSNVRFAAVRIELF